MMSELSDREKVAEEHFSNLSSGFATQPKVVRNDGLKEKFIRLERLKITEQSKWWDATTLKQYMKLNRIPRGLRAQIFPTYDDLEPDLLLRWEKELTNNLMNLMEILIINAERKVAKLRNEIKDVEKESWI